MGVGAGSARKIILYGYDRIKKSLSFHQGSTLSELVYSPDGVTPNQAKKNGGTAMAQNTSVKLTPSAYKQF